MSKIFSLDSSVARGLIPWQGKKEKGKEYILLFCRRINPLAKEKGKGKRIYSAILWGINPPLGK